MFNYYHVLQKILFLTFVNLLSFSFSYATNDTNDEKIPLSHNGLLPLAKLKIEDSTPPQNINVELQSLKEQYKLFSHKVISLLPNKWFTTVSEFAEQKTSEETTEAKWMFVKAYHTSYMRDGRSSGMDIDAFKRYNSHIFEKYFSYSTFLIDLYMRKLGLLEQEIKAEAKIEGLMKTLGDDIEDQKSFFYPYIKTEESIKNFYRLGYTLLKYGFLINTKKSIFESSQLGSIILQALACSHYHLLNLTPSLRSKINGPKCLYILINQRQYPFVNYNKFHSNTETLKYLAQDGFKKAQFDQGQLEELIFEQVKYDTNDSSSILYSQCPHLKAAEEWYEKAAAQGHLGAKNRVSFFKNSRQSRAKELCNRAVKLFCLDENLSLQYALNAAQKYHSKNGFFIAGSHYEKSEKLLEAFNSYSKAVELGSADSALSLAYLFENHPELYNGEEPISEKIKTLKKQGNKRLEAWQKYREHFELRF